MMPLFTEDEVMKISAFSQSLKKEMRLSKYILSVCCIYCGVDDPNKVLDKSQDRSVTFARQCACHFMIKMGYKRSDIALFFGITNPLIAYYESAIVRHIDLMGDESIVLKQIEKTIYNR